MESPRVRGSVIGFFLKSYLVILLLPVLFGSIVVIKSGRIVLEDTISINQRILEQAQTALDRTQTTVDELIAQISYNPRLSAILHRDSLGLNEVYSVREAQRELSTHFVLSDFIQEVFLWSGATGILLTTETTFLDASRFYHPFYSFPDTQYGEWSGYFSSKRHNKLWMPALTMGEGVEAVRVLPYVQSLPLDIPSMNRGFVMVTIREDAVQALLQPSVEDHDGWAAVLDGDGNRLTTVGTGLPTISMEIPSGNGSVRVRSEGRDYIVTYRASESSGLRFVSVTPARDLLRKTQYIRNLAIIVDAVILILGAAAALAFARRQSDPLIRLFRTAHVDRADGRRFSDAVASVDEQFASMEASVKRQRPLVESSQFQRLLSGQIADAGELATTFSVAAVRDPHERYALVLLQLHREVTDTTPETLHRMNYAKAALRELLWSRLGETGYIHDVDASTLVALVVADGVDAAAFKEGVDSTIEAVRTVASKRFGIEFFSAAGSVRHSLAELALAFEEAQEVADGTSAAVGGKPVFWYSAGRGDNLARYYYPIAEETRVLTAVKSGDSTTISAVLNEVSRRNFGGEPLTPQTIHLLLTEMLSTTIKAARELKIDALHCVDELNRRIAECADVQQAQAIVESLRSTYQTLCDIADSRKKSHNRMLCDRVMEYIVECYSDSSLSLTSVADRFGMSEVYFSSFFKEQSGRNFGEFLEGVRLEAAARLLAQARTVAEVADAVGYNSSNTFRRAFKRRFGVSPSAHRRELTLDS